MKGQTYRRVKRPSKRKTKRIHVGGIKSNIKVTVANEFKDELDHLLWLDHPPENTSLNLQYEPGVYVSLKDVMNRLGGTDEILNTACFAICGPTGVGKTKFINKIKERYNAEVINMDTMQVYDFISVGTGRTDMANTNGAYLYGVYTPNKEFHILDYMMDVFSSIKKIKQHGNPILFEGASKSLLNVVSHTFPNISIFGIKAVNEENITSNITKRISEKVLKMVVMELSKHLILKNINIDSPVLKNNTEVYSLVLSTFTQDQLNDANLQTKLDTEYAEKIKQLTLMTIQKNIELHKLQYQNLQKNPQIKWFTNEDSSVELLEKSFAEKLSTTGILNKTNDLDFINTADCSAYKRNPSEQKCIEIDALFHTGDRDKMLEYCATLNVPLLPKKGSQEIVLGTTKYLLAYGMLPYYFKTFAVKPELWTLDTNMYLIECIANNFIKSNIIRIVTTPLELIDEKHNYRITANEICVLKSYGYTFYKYDSPEFTNIYFCSKENLIGCKPVDVSTGAFKCNGQTLGTFIYF